MLDASVQPTMKCSGPEGTSRSYGGWDVSIELNGFRAYAPFQTGELLALLQLETLAFQEIDISLPAPESDEPLPF